MSVITRGYHRFSPRPWLTGWAAAGRRSGTAAPPRVPRRWPAGKLEGKDNDCISFQLPWYTNCGINSNHSRFHIVYLYSILYIYIRMLWNKYGTYPLVNVYITMENHHFNWKIHYLYGHFKLPEGIYIYIITPDIVLPLLWKWFMFIYLYITWKWPLPAILWNRYVYIVISWGIDIP